MKLQKLPANWITPRRFLDGLLELAEKHSRKQPLILYNNIFEFIVKLVTVIIAVLFWTPIYIYCFVELVIKLIIVTVKKVLCLV
jgi:hypothetical protein